MNRASRRSTRPLATTIVVAATLALLACGRGDPPPTEPAPVTDTPPTTPVSDDPAPNDPAPQTPAPDEPGTDQPPNPFAPGATPPPDGNPFAPGATPPGGTAPPPDGNNPFSPGDTPKTPGVNPFAPGDQPANDTPPAQPGSLAGTYLGAHQGNPVGLRLEATDARLTGTLLMMGWALPVQGTVKDGKATGTVQSPLGDSAFTAVRTKDGLRLTMSGAPGEPAQTVDFRPAAADKLPVERVERDPRIVGNWRYTYSYSSDGFSVVWDDWLRLHPDGTFKFGERNTPDGWDYSGVVEGEWRTTGEVVFTRTKANPRWVAAVRFAVDGDSMVVYWPNGNKQYFDRIR